MGIFGQSSLFDADVEKATSQTNTNDNWSFILDVCDKVTTNPRSAKDCLKSIMKRMGHPDPHVVMQAITLLDACANNCGKPFHLEIASREFETEFRRLLSKAQTKVSLKMRQVLKNWAENDFKNDSELNLIPSFYIKLRSEGFDFSNLNEKPIKTTSKPSLPKDPNVVSSQQEEDDIAKAIELSLKETSSSPKHQSNTDSGRSGAENTSNPSLYPTFGSIGESLGTFNSAGAVDSTSQQEPRKVRALYDFEAAEENELTFFSGEIIHVVDDTDPNWWKGLNQRGEGLFPSNFVTADLSVDPDRLDINQQHNSFGKDDANNSKQQKTDTVSVSANQLTEINESKIDRLLHLLHEANPEDPSQDSFELLSLEKEVHQMGPLIDSELERVDRKHAQLTQLSSDLVDAINLYHSLMRDDCNTQYCQVGASVIGNTPGLSYQGVYNVGYLRDPVAYPLSQKSISSGIHSQPYTGELQQHNNFNGTANTDIRFPVQVGQSNPQYQNAMQLNPLQAQMISQSQHHQGVSIQPQMYGVTAPISTQHQNKANFQVFHIDPHHHQQPQQFSSQISTISEPTSTVQNINAAANVTMMPQHSHFISTQSPQQPPIQYSAGQQLPIQTSPYGLTLPNTAPTFLAQSALRNNDNGKTTIQPQVNINSFSGNGESQIQHQTAASSIGCSQSTSTVIAPIQSSLSSGIAAPSQPSFLLQNDIKDNIAIYQQQR